MDKLITLYNHMSQSKRIFNMYTRIGKENLGNKFSFISTNARGILPKSGKSYGGFYKAFKIIKDVEGIPREEWERTNPGGQSTEKQHTVKMRESEFFMVRNNTYILTSRGIVFEKMIKNSELSDNEKRFLCYLLILSSYFSKIPNYILKRTQQVFESYNSFNITNEEVLDSILEFVHASNNKAFTKKDSFLFDFAYFDTFAFDFDEIGFLKIYKESSEEEKKSFKKYIYNQQVYESDTISIIEKKYESGGNYTLTTLIDNAWILYVSQKLISISEKINSFEDFIYNVIEFYNELFDVDESQLKTFIFDTDKNKSVFNVIYSQIYNIPIIKYEVEKDLTSEEIENIGIIDSTDELGRLKSEQVAVSLKKLAKSHSNYICECDDLEGCKYFTSKENNKNFLEIHHLIPREFANDFDETIEVLSNYVALCPNCHRKIHLAVDRERSHLLKSLLNKRKELLANDGLSIEEKTLFQYYGFDKNNV